jgi:hypothetical protein
MLMIWYRSSVVTQQALQPPRGLARAGLWKKTKKNQWKGKLARMSPPLPFASTAPAATPLHSPLRAAGAAGCRK